MQTFFGIMLVALLQVQPQEVPKAKQGTYAVTNARIETVTNGVIENGTIVVQADRIIAIGANVEVPEGAEIIDANGRSVFPGMIDGGTTLGLTEIGSVQETNDSQEVGDITPQMESLTAINPNAVAIPVTRVSGVTTVVAEPSGGTLPGAASVINLVGYTPEQMSTGTRLQVLSWPTTGRRGFWDRRSDDDIEKAAKESLAKLDDVFDDAELYSGILEAWEAGTGDRQPEFAPELAALVPVVRGEMRLMVRVNRAKDIEKAIDWVTERGYMAVLSGVSEGWRVADKIAESGFPVIVGPVFSTPTRPGDRYDRAYANAGLLNAAGVTVAIRSGESENVRNLPFSAGFAATYGMGREAALKAVTINAATALGIDGDYGSLEVGKKANFLVSNGDPFEPATEISEVFIDGFRVPIDSRHIQLYKEFLNRDSGRLQPVEIVPPVRN
ncbi:MAG: amidohydrolase family protein [Rhodothermales bacterium]|nr:amidohydrolase family protein [Rhodothermales bacterium]